MHQHVLNALLNALIPHLVERYAIDGGKDVYPHWWQAELHDMVGLNEVL
jgi:hypothetical protein